MQEAQRYTDLKACWQWEAALLVFVSFPLEVISLGLKRVLRGLSLPPPLIGVDHPQILKKIVHTVPKWDAGNACVSGRCEYVSP